MLNVEWIMRLNSFHFSLGFEASCALLLIWCRWIRNHYCHLLSKNVIVLWDGKKTANTIWEFLSLSTQNVWGRQGMIATMAICVKS